MTPPRIIIATIIGGLIGFLGVIGLGIIFYGMVHIMNTVLSMH